MPKVYIPQVPSRFDPGTGLFIPTVSMHTADKFGDRVECLPPGAGRLHVAQIAVALREKLRDITEDDWLVAVGDPSMIAAASVIMFKKTGKLRLLKWDRVQAIYLPVEIPV